MYWEMEGQPEEVKYLACVQLTRFFTSYVFLKCVSAGLNRGFSAAATVEVIVKSCKKIVDINCFDKLVDEIDGQLERILVTGGYREGFSWADFAGSEDKLNGDSELFSVVNCLLGMDKYSVLLLLFHHIEMFSVKEAADFFKKSVVETRSDLRMSESKFAEKLGNARLGAVAGEDVAEILDRLDNWFGEELRELIEEEAIRGIFRDNPPEF